MRLWRRCMALRAKTRDVVMKAMFAKRGKSADAAPETAGMAMKSDAKRLAAEPVDDPRGGDRLTPMESLMMRREVRVGVAAIAVLLLIFGYVFVSKISENGAASTPVASAGDADETTAENDAPSNPPPTVVTADGSYSPADGSPRIVSEHVGAFASETPREDLAPPNTSYLPPRRAIDNAAGKSPTQHAHATNEGNRVHATASDNAVADDVVGKPRYGDRTFIEATPVVEPAPEGDFVVAREAPAEDEKRPQAAAGSGSRTYVSVAGDTPASIAERLYGDARYAAALMAYNGVEIAPAVAVNAGGEVLVPQLVDLRRAFGRLIPESANAAADGLAVDGSAANRDVPRIASVPSGVGLADEPSRGVEDAPARRDAVATRIYVVGRGETVYDIARKELGRVSRWRDIVELNGEQLGGDVDAVSPGMKLRLPDDGRSDVARQRGELLWR